MKHGVGEVHDAQLSRGGLQFGLVGHVMGEDYGQAKQRGDQHDVEDHRTRRDDPAPVAGQLTHLLGHELHLAGGEDVRSDKVFLFEHFDGQKCFGHEFGGTSVHRHGHAFIRIGGQQVFARGGQIQLAGYGLARNQDALTQHTERDVQRDVALDLESFDGKLRRDNQAVVENRPGALAPVRRRGGHRREFLRN